MKYFIFWTADWKSSKLWSAQLWTQFKQLRIEALKSQDFNRVWTRWTRWLSTLKALAINANRWYNGFSNCWKCCGRKALEKSSRSVGRKLQTVETFCAPVRSVEKGVENPLATRWLAADFYPLNTKPLVYVFAWKVTLMWMICWMHLNFVNFSCMSMITKSCYPFL